jgi:hypothetical protein
MMEDSSKQKHRGKGWGETVEMNGQTLTVIHQSFDALRSAAANTNLMISLVRNLGGTVETKYRPARTVALERNGRAQTLRVRRYTRRRIDYYALTDWGDEWYIEISAPRHVLVDDGNNIKGVICPICGEPTTDGYGDSWMCGVCSLTGEEINCLVYIRTDHTLHEEERQKEKRQEETPDGGGDDRDPYDISDQLKW